jgi:CDP-diacylglycerol--inositol 3-phosphatidyltransferase
LLKLYYTNRLVLGGLCAGNEGFFTLLYLLKFYAGPVIPLGPLASVAASFGYGHEMEAVRAFTFFVCFPIMAIKQFMNLVQLQQACIDIVELDDSERANKPKKN